MAHALPILLPLCYPTPPSKTANEQMEENSNNILYISCRKPESLHCWSTSSPRGTELLFDQARLHETILRSSFPHSHPCLESCTSILYPNGQVCMPKLCPTAFPHLLPFIPHPSLSTAQLQPSPLVADRAVLPLPVLPSTAALQGLGLGS